MMAKPGFMPLVKSPIIPSMAEKDNVSTKLGFTVSDDYSINKFMDFSIILSTHLQLAFILSCL